MGFQSIINSAAEGVVAGGGKGEVGLRVEKERGKLIYQGFPSDS